MSIYEQYTNYFLILAFIIITMKPFNKKAKEYWFGLKSF